MDFLNQTKSFYAEKTVLVTGGTGLVGTSIVQELLKRGAKVRVPIHKRPLNINDNRIETISNIDLTRQDDCSRVLKDVNYVFHAAGPVGAAGVTSDYSMFDITETLCVTAQMLRATWTAGAERFLLFSSSTVYPALNYPVKEDDAWSGPPHPKYFGYGWARRCMERLAEFVAQNSKTKIAIVRPTAVYGPFDNLDLSTSHVIPALIMRALKKENPFTVWGTGDEVRDFIYVSDLARGSLLALEKYANCDPINLGYGKITTIKDIVGIILKIVGHDRAKIIFDASKPTTIPFRAVDTSKAKEVLGFEPQVSLEEGLKNTIEWYKSLNAF